jgi:hypothetical protein
MHRCCWRDSRECAARDLGPQDTLLRDFPDQPVYLLQATEWEWRRAQILSLRLDSLLSDWRQ